MKKSEYRAKRMADYSTDPTAVPDLWLDHDCSAAEAAGVQWDPEEEALPERLAVYPTGEGRARPMVECVERQMVREMTHREATEAVRRYNAWPELRRLVDAPNEIVPVISTRGFQAHLLAILDGKP